MNQMTVDEYISKIEAGRVDKTLKNLK